MAFGQAARAQSPIGFGGIGADQPDPAGSFGAEQVEELLEGGAVVTGGRPYESAGVVIDDDHQVAAPAPIRDLIDPDPGQPIEGIVGGSSIGHDASADGTDGPPGDPHQFDDRGLGGVVTSPAT